LASPRISELTGGERGEPVVRTRKLNRHRRTILTRDSYLHYNLLRPAHKARVLGLRAEDALNFQVDPIWRRVRSLPVRKRAIILLADRETLVARVRSRTTREHEKRGSYATEKWLELYQQVDLDELYQAWRDALADAGIPFLELDATSKAFALVDSSPLDALVGALPVGSLDQHRR
jgi:hypothetical protein